MGQKSIKSTKMVEKSCYNLLLLNLKCNIIEYV